MINAGSFSRLDIFETCKKRAELQYIHKIPEPDRGKAPKGEWANDRGTRVHDEVEAYLKGERKTIPVEAMRFQAEIEAAKRIHSDGNAITEEMWCYNDAWVPCKWNDWDEIAFRIKTDLTVFLSPREAVIIDYKTGRRFGNESKHAQQLQLYAVGATLRYPKLEHITSELWYFDQDELVSMEFTAEQAKRFFKGWNDRNLAMLSCVDFPPTPSKSNCRWCPYTSRGTGHCAQGVIS